MAQTSRVTAIDDYMTELLAPAKPKPQVVAPAPVPVPASPVTEVKPVAAEPARPLTPALSPQGGEREKAPENFGPRLEPVKGEQQPQRRRAADRSERWIGFVVAGQSFGVEVLKVIEVQTLCEITPVPGAGPDLLGAINLRGQIVSVLDLARRLGFGVTPDTGATRIIVVDYRGHPVGLRVDGVSEVITAMVSSVEPTPVLGGRIADGWVRGVLRNKGETVLLLDPIRLLADAEGV